MAELSVRRASRFGTDLKCRLLPYGYYTLTGILLYTINTKLF